MDSHGPTSSLPPPPQCRPYLVNLLPCLATLAQRPEESVHEALATALPPLFTVLGSFTNDLVARGFKRVHDCLIGCCFG